MSHPQQMNFVSEVKKKYPEFFTNSKVLEIGSLNINGTIRIFFTNCLYIGVDIGPGKDVDIISSGHDLKYSDNFFDTVCSCECFEHNPYWAETFLNMHRMTKSQGLIFMSCATEGRAEHGTSRTSPQDSPLTINNGWDYYKNLSEIDFINAFDIDELFSDYKFSVDHSNHDLYFYGKKR